MVVGSCTRPDRGRRCVEGELLPRGGPFAAWTAEQPVTDLLGLVPQRFRTAGVSGWETGRTPFRLGGQPGVFRAAVPFGTAAGRAQLYVRAIVAHYVA